MMEEKEIQAVMSSEYDEWETPPELFQHLHEQYNFTLDPCAQPSTAKCDKYYTPEDDGLSKSWEGERVFVNPPYGREISDWVEKCVIEAKRAKIIVLLIPARTDTRYWHNDIFGVADCVVFLKGRLKFWKHGEPADSATFPSALVIYEDGYECETEMTTMDA